jgi:hypothetical protein
VTEADVDVHAEDEQTAGHAAHIVEELAVAVAVGNRLLVPAGERVG